MPPLRILVADSDEIIQQVMTGLVTTQPGWEVCGEAADGGGVAEKVAKLKPDFAVLDINLLRPNGWEAARQVLQSNPLQKFIILGSIDVESEAVAREAFHAGALGYVLKANAPRDLVTAIKAVQEGRTFFTPRIAESILRDYLKSSEETGPKQTVLSEQERIAVKFLAREAATTLGEQMRKPSRPHPSLKYLVIAAVIVVSAAVGWANFHEVLEDKFPIINKLLIKTNLKPPPPAADEGNPNAKVWIDLHTGLYYCPGAEVYGKTSKGRFAKQHDAQLDQFQPANRTPCN